MRIKDGLVLTALLGLGLQAVTTATATAQTPGCLSAGEAQAEQIRRLKTTLMVGALQCSHASHLKVTESYNAFVETHSKAIVDHDAVLSGYFKRVHGATHRRAMDRHVTSTANKVATQSYKTAGFCEKVAALAEQALSQSPQTLISVAQTNTLAPATIKSCAPATVQSAGATVLK
ncbi:MAG: hypothetical protein AAF337_12095 [Pseudomonadota bacterium]